MNIKSFLKTIIYGTKANSESYIKYLQSKGMRIGDNTTIYVPTKTSIDETRPWMIEIGSNVNITEGVTILTHGYDWSVLKVKYGDVLGSAGKVVIGNNVFIGMNTTILKGVTIGDNCIIGAGSILTGGIYPDNSVIVGQPAKVLCTVDEYYKKRVKLQLDEAKECAVEYKMVFGKRPPKDIFYEFFWIFEERNGWLIPSFDSMMNLTGNRDVSYRKFRETKPIFENYDAFLDWCFKNDD